MVDSFQHYHFEQVFDLMAFGEGQAGRPGGREAGRPGGREAGRRVARRGRQDRFIYLVYRYSGF